MAGDCSILEGDIIEQGCARDRAARSAATSPSASQTPTLSCFTTRCGQTPEQEGPEESISAGLDGPECHDLSSPCSRLHFPSSPEQRRAEQRESDAALAQEAAERILQRLNGTQAHKVQVPPPPSSWLSSPMRRSARAGLVGEPGRLQADGEPGPRLQAAGARGERRAARRPGVPDGAACVRLAAAPRAGFASAEGLLRDCRGSALSWGQPEATTRSG